MSNEWMTLLGRRSSGGVIERGIVRVRAGDQLRRPKAVNRLTSERTLDDREMPLATASHVGR